MICIQDHHGIRQGIQRIFQPVLRCGGCSRQFFQRNLLLLQLGDDGLDRDEPLQMVVSAAQGQNVEIHMVAAAEAVLVDDLAAERNHRLDRVCHGGNHRRIAFRATDQIGDALTPDLVQRPSGLLLERRVDPCHLQFSVKDHDQIAHRAGHAAQPPQLLAQRVFARHVTHDEDGRRRLIRLAARLARAPDLKVVAAVRQVQFVEDVGHLALGQDAVQGVPGYLGHVRRQHLAHLAADQILRLQQEHRARARDKVRAVAGMVDLEKQVRHRLKRGVQPIRSFHLLGVLSRTRQHFGQEAGIFGNHLKVLAVSSPFRRLLTQKSGQAAIIDHGHQKVTRCALCRQKRLQSGRVAKRSGAVDKRGLRHRCRKVIRRADGGTPALPPLMVNNPARSGRNSQQRPIPRSGAISSCARHNPRVIPSGGLATKFRTALIAAMRRSIWLPLCSTALAFHAQVEQVDALQQANHCKSASSDRSRLNQN